MVMAAGMGHCMGCCRGNLNLNQNWALLWSPSTSIWSPRLEKRGQEDEHPQTAKRRVGYLVHSGLTSRFPRQPQFGQIAWMGGRGARGKARQDSQDSQEVN